MIGMKSMHSKFGQGKQKEIMRLTNNQVYDISCIFHLTAVDFFVYNTITTALERSVAKLLGSLKVFTARPIMIWAATWQNQKKWLRPVKA